MRHEPRSIGARQVPSPLHASVVHGRLSLHTYEVPKQMPPVHTSVLVQAAPSLHGVLLATGRQSVVARLGRQARHTSPGLVVFSL